MHVRVVSVVFWGLAAGYLAGCAHAAERSAEAKTRSGPGVQVADGWSVLLGSSDMEAIRPVIAEHAPEVRSCYEKRLTVNPGLQGSVAIKWVIEPDGSTSNAVAEDQVTTLRDPELHRCMTSRIASWRFPKPAGGGVAIITYPWIFLSQSGAASVLGAHVSRAEVGKSPGESGGTIHQCYEQRLAEKPKLEGKVVVGFTIRPDGSVADAAVVPAGTTLDDAEFHRCIARVMAAWSYPGFASDEPVRIALPFVFRRQGPASK